MKQAIIVSLTRAMRAATRRLPRAWRMAVASAGVGVAAAALAGCGPSVGDVCAKWDSRDCPGWEGKAECTRAGTSLQDSAGAQGCDAEFQEYLQCVGEVNYCNWEDVCADEKDTLVKCTGASF